MGEKRRLQIAGGIYHVTARGNARESVFTDEIDFAVFLRTLAPLVARFGWLCHSFCLMPNHYHLLLETPEPNLSKGMRLVNGTYAQRFNGRHRRAGHVFQGPYRAEVVERDGHLLEVCRYIALNPVRAHLCADPAAWPWSSYRALTSAQDAPTFLTLDLVHSLFDGAHGFRRFVAGDP